MTLERSGREQRRYSATQTELLIERAILAAG